MPTFEVHYSFTCRKCQTANENRIAIIAASKPDAAQFAHASTTCSQCKGHLEEGQHLTTTIKEL